MSLSPPNTITCGCSVSLTAIVSLKNSGLVRRPKPFPTFFLDIRCKIGSITFCVVPGITVLFIIIIGLCLVLESNFPILFVTFLIIVKSISPFLFCGVPTVTKIRLHFFMAKMFDDILRPTFRDLLSIDCNFGS